MNAANAGAAARFPETCGRKALARPGRTTGFGRAVGAHGCVVGEMNAMVLRFTGAGKCVRVVHSQMGSQSESMT